MPARGRRSPAVNRSSAPAMASRTELSTSRAKDRPRQVRSPAAKGIKPQDGLAPAKRSGRKLSGSGHSRGSRWVRYGLYRMRVPRRMRMPSNSVSAAHRRLPIQPAG